jgi:Haem-binding uptake, Tiki superfamily, ChaN
MSQASVAKRSGRQSRRTAAQMHALTAVRQDIRLHDRVGTSKYLREFSDSFRECGAALTEEQLEQKISAASIVLIGDYHALPASQRFAADLIEKCAQQRRVVLAVEAVLARDRRILEVWWRREMAEGELRQRLRFDREWGYPWDPFYELLRSARDHAEGIYGLDCMPRQDLRRIRSRDRHAAAKICEIREHYPNAAIFVLFGESHMAPQHLPRCIRELMPREQVLTVLQSVDALYWQAVSQNTTAVSVSENTVCVMNSSPLEKYESYRLCLERWKATKDEQQDFAPAIYNLIFSLAKSLGFRLDSPRNGTQPKFLADSLPEVVSVDHFPYAVENISLEEKSCLYLASSNSFFIREFQIAEAAAECARFLHFACRGMTEIDLHGKPVESALARFASRLLCPEANFESSSSDLGDSLYRLYLAGRISGHCLRRLFLSHLENRQQADALLAEISKLARP